MGQNGGKRPGAGRKKGSKLPKTLEREKVLEAVRQRVMGIAHRLVDKQLVLANGQQFLYKIEKEWIKTGKGEKAGYWRNKKPELVEDESTIRWYLENMVDEANGDVEKEDDPSATFYFLTVKEPNNQAIDSMLNRTFGSPVQSTKLIGDDGKAAAITIQVSEVIAKKNKLK